MIPCTIRYSRSRACRSNAQASIATQFRFQDLEPAVQRFAGQAASAVIAIKPFLRPDPTIESRSADVAVRMQQVQSSV
jgi:hypothetical protein